MGPHDYIPPRPTGNTAEARFMQWVYDMLTRWLKVTSTSTVKASWTSGGLSFRAAAPKGGGAPPQAADVQRFRVKSVHGDYLTCRTWDGTTEGGSDVYVAKLPEIRHVGSETWVDGSDLTYTYSSRSGTEDGQRTASDGTNTIVEIIVPVYHCNNHSDGYTEIFAVQPTGGTGVSVSDTPVIWLDPTYRFWARVPS